LVLPSLLAAAAVRVGHHEGDTYNPVDPSTLPSRLTAAGFTDVNVRTNEFGWAVIARGTG
jgi:hypothetical protein